VGQVGQAGHGLPDRSFSRREFLAAALLAPAIAQLQPPSGGQLLGTIPFGAPGTRRTPLDRLLGSGLDARLFTDLSSVGADRLAIPNAAFFVRTAADAGIPSSASWQISIGGLVRQPAAVDLASLEQSSRAMDRCLIECAGNSDPANYGLMSVAAWDGAPMTALLDRVNPTSGAHRILVTGVDPASPSRTSVPGASWIFSRDELRDAFLATRMNGAPLPRDHGAPARLVVPGWYGCACIKWVNRIELVADDAPATSQMIEYAGRTHQSGQPALAREYTPAVIDSAAVPVRIEKWTAAGRVLYRVIGIIWGGSKPTNALAIRFKTGDPWVPVEDCPLPATTRTWSLWTHTWRPSEAGRYQIVLKVMDPSIRTRRLDLFYYVRDVMIEN
jgi:DMSO/TMAO reductase YedYZ molybdopterin-dependent catalytic subunit